MKLAEADILLVPGLGQPNPDHWQHRWLGKMKTAQMVNQENWDTPTLEPWIKNLHLAVEKAERPIVLVGHSLGATTIVHAASSFTDTKVRGALLVSVPDVDNNKNVPKATAPFKNPPRDPLLFPSLLISTTDDPYCTQERAAEMASCWGSEFHSAGEGGHLNVESGHGPWPEGMMMLVRLLQRI